MKKLTTISISLFNLIEVSSTIPVKIVLCKNAKFMNYKWNMVLRKQNLILRIFSVICKQCPINNYMVWWPQCGQKYSKKTLALKKLGKFTILLVLVFGPIFSTHIFGVIAYFFPIITNRPLPTHNYGIGNTKYNMHCYRQSYWCSEKIGNYKTKYWISSIGGC